MTRLESTMKDVLDFMKEEANKLLEEGYEKDDIKWMFDPVTRAILNDALLRARGIDKRG